jgi:(p)ppGpp synthase/HD superfamily hydrolase
MKMYSNLAFEIASNAFHEKVDKNGDPYILHLIRVSQVFKDDQLHTIALLHDLLENCEEWTEHLLRQNFPDRIVDAVVALTQKEQEQYEYYIHRLAGNEDARIVKISDLVDNMDLTRIKKSLTESDIKRTEKYLKAYIYLFGF